MQRKYAEKKDLVGPDVMRQTERIVMLQVIDNQWKDPPVVDGRVEAGHEREMEALQFVGGDGSTGATPVVTGQKTGRNDPCPCGSGKKYKKCHGS